MDSDHSSQRSLPATPPRQTSQQSALFTPTPPSTNRHHHQMLQTPPSHMPLPLTLPMSTMSAMTMSSMPLSMPMSMPMSMPLALPTDATTATGTPLHNVFGEHMYYGQDGGSASNGNNGGNNNGNNNGHNNHAEVANMGLDLGLDSAMDMNLGAGIGMDMGMDLAVGMDMDDIDMGAIMHMSMPEDNNHMSSYAGFSYGQASSCNAQASSSSHGSTATNTNQNTVRQTTPQSQSMYLFNEPGMFMDSTTASPYGDPPTGYSNSSTTGGGFPFNTPASMAPTTLSSSYPSVYPPIPQASTAAMEPPTAGSSTFTTSMSLPTTSTLSTMSTIAVNSPPLTRSRARHGRTHSARSASDPIPSTEGHGRGHGHGRHTRGISFDSVDDDDNDDYFDDCDMDDGTPATHQHRHQLLLRPGPNINGPPPTDPTDWRARLRYCEQATHKASLGASLVRLLDPSEAHDEDEKLARQAANIRFDKVREQRLKDRNNEAAKRSRQRKVARIEAAEQKIAKLQRENQQLRRQLAAANSSSSLSSSSPGGGKVHKGRQPTTPQRRGSGHSGRLNGSSPNGRGKHSRCGSDESAIVVGDEDEDEDEDNEGDDHNNNPRHGNSIVVGMLA